MYFDKRRYQRKKPWPLGFGPVGHQPVSSSQILTGISHSQTHHHFGVPRCLPPTSGCTSWGGGNSCSLISYFHKHPANTGILSVDHCGLRLSSHHPPTELDSGRSCNSSSYFHTHWNHLEVKKMSGLCNQITSTMWMPQIQEAKLEKSQSEASPLHHTTDEVIAQECSL